MKIVVYTAIFGNYDQLLDPLIAHDDIDFVYFSEKKIPNLSTWLFRPLKKDWGCPIKNNRYCKMHPHALFKNDNYEASIYLDANILVVDSWFYNRAFNLLKENCRIALVNHPIRYCCFQELETVLRFNLISSETYKIALKFLTENFSKNKGLFEANLIYRNHNDDKLNAFCEEWWTCFNHVCNRDQVTLPYLIEKHRLTPTFFFNSKLKSTRNHSSLITFFHSKPSKKETSDHTLLNKNYIIPTIWHLPIHKVLIFHAEQYLGYNINLNQPKTFNETIISLKASPPTAFQTQISDRLALKDFVECSSFDVKMPKTFSIGNDFNDLISQELPNQFLIKTTHSKDSTWKITNQETVSEKLKEEINSSIQAPYGDNAFEPNFLNIPRLLFAEEDLEIQTYKYGVFVFNGQAMLIQVEEKKNASFFRCFYSNSWLKEPFTLGHPILDKNVPKPQTLQLMLDFSNYIGENFTFIRIDFYEFNSQLYLDGVEFFPGSGHERFSSIKYDYLIGQYFKEKK